MGDGRDRGDGASVTVTVPHQSRPLGWVLVAIGWPLRLVVILLLLAEHLHTTLRSVGTIGLAVFAASFVLPVPLYFLAAWTRRRGRRHLTVALVEDELGEGPFVLYLRSFSDDPQRARLAPSLLAAIGGPARSLLSDEEQLAHSVRWFGPMVAVGRPRERLPYAGASRVYLPDTGWRETVVRLMSTTQLLLVGLGPGEQLRWELEQAAVHVPPQRIILLVPYDENAYAELREAVRARGALPQPLPAVPPPKRRRRYRYGIRGAVHFDADWAPQFVSFATAYPHPGRRITYSFLTRFSEKFGELGRSPRGKEH
ncbi:hypothetical protein [Streptomyces sp. NRRL F-5126]|uniref:hypothetical protein n=1 Tax=Streptomyces sp. NRRL F-5126 TaxID=1463857 RepID=UPI00068DB8B8|nr:hypothetical protein [Streptomyces sp. NRRL F-5126]